MKLRLDSVSWFLEGWWQEGGRLTPAPSPLPQKFAELHCCCPPPPPDQGGRNERIFNARASLGSVNQLRMQNPDTRGLRQGHHRLLTPPLRRRASTGLARPRTHKHSHTHARTLMRGTSTYKKSALQTLRILAIRFFTLNNYPAKS